MRERGESLLRLVVFSPSLIADIDNPGATSTRALLGALSAAGHDLTHLELRGNALLDQQLRTRGSAALRSLNARHPEIRVRQYDLPPSRQNRGVWFGTEVSTADAVVALPGTPDEVLELIAPFETPHLVRVVPPGAVGDLTIAPLLCVERRAPLVRTIDLLAVAYDNIDVVRCRAIPEHAERVVVGASDLMGWRYLPEVEVAELYRSARAAMVLETDERPEAVARSLLPVAAGCHLVGGESTVDAGPLWSDGFELPVGNDSADIATRLVDEIKATLSDKYRMFATTLPGARRA